MKIKQLLFHFCILAITLLSLNACNHCDQALKSQNDSLKKVIAAMPTNTCPSRIVLPLPQMKDTLGQYLNFGVPQKAPAVKMSTADLMNQLQYVSQDSVLTVILEDSSSVKSMWLAQDSAGMIIMIKPHCTCPGMPPPWCPDTSYMAVFCPNE